jgi:hypothetical protein
VPPLACKQRALFLLHGAGCESRRGTPRPILSPRFDLTPLPRTRRPADSKPWLFFLRPIYRFPRGSR